MKKISLIALFGAICACTEAHAVNFRQYAALKLTAPLSSNTEVKQKIKTTIEKNDKEIKQLKQTKYSIAKTERKMIDKTVKDFHQTVTHENKKKYSNIKTQQQKAREEELKRLQEKEEEIKNFYVEKVEKNQKEAEKLKSEYEELAKLEKKYWQDLKEAQKKAEEKNRIAVHTLSTNNKKKKKYRSKSTTLDSCTTPKPFVVKKIGFSDSFYYTHRKGKGSTDCKIAVPIGKADFPVGKLAVL